jgi:hypothetical protein
MQQKSRFYGAFGDWRAGGRIGTSRIAVVIVLTWTHPRPISPFTAALRVLNLLETLVLFF